MSLIAVGTYTRKESFVNGKAEGIYLYRLSDTSEFSLLSTTIAINPSYLTFSNCGKFLYVVQETGPECGGSAFISSYLIENDYKLTLLNTVSSFGYSPCYILADKLNRFVFVANYMGKVIMNPINSDGSLGDSSKADIIEFENVSSTHARQDTSHPHSIILSPDEKYCYVLDLGTDRISIFEVDYQNGKLIPIINNNNNSTSNSISLNPHSGPRHFVFHPNEKYVYAINELSNTITIISFNKVTGNLNILDYISTLPQDYTGESYCSDIHISPNGKYLYGANRGHNSIVIFNINQETGLLQYNNHISCHGEFPRKFIINNNGTKLFVGNQNTDTIVTYDINESGGNLVYLNSINVLTPVCLQIYARS
jgi:6-phosphogluconolactonase